MTPTDLTDPRFAPAVARYQDALPDYEFQALSAWLTTFYPFQLEWLLEPARFAVCNKSRQIGITHTSAAVSVLWGAFHGELTTTISIGEREAKECLSYARKHRDVLVALGSQMAAPFGSDSSLEFGFASGGRAIALPSTGGRSFSGNVFLDEHAYQEHAAEVWDAALAVTLHGYRARVASTPNGVGNEFYQLWTDPKTNKGWVRHEIPLQRAIADGMTVDIADCWTMAKGDQRLFDQIFGCKFLDGELQYLPSPAVLSCREPSPGDTAGPAYAGLDIGKSIDATALYVVRKGKDKRWHVVHSAECKRTSQADIDKIVAAAFSKYDVRCLAVDSTGLGTFPAETLQKRHGVARVLPVAFSMNSKEELATTLYTTIVGDTLRLPESDERLVEDLCSIQRIITQAGNVRYDAPHTASGHADRAWALALALHAATNAPLPPPRGHITGDLASVL